MENRETHPSTISFACGYSTEALCLLTGLSAVHLRRWYRYGLIGQAGEGGLWSEQQLAQIHHLLQLTASGATLPQLLAARLDFMPLLTSGWPAHRGNLLWQLEFGSERALCRDIRQLSTTYRVGDLVNHLLVPLNRWLQHDTRRGASRRLSRFDACVRRHAEVTQRTTQRQGLTPLFLEAVSVRDETEIWLESLRLSGEGFCVETSSDPEIEHAVSPKKYAHHLLWCGAGITQARFRRFCASLAAGEPVMLCGPQRDIVN